VTDASPHDLLTAIADALRIDAPGAVDVTGAGSLPSAFRVTDLAIASIAAAGLAVRQLIGSDGVISVDRDLASHWFGMSIRPIGWQLPPLWDAVAGGYATADGWIRLHTNAPHHRGAALGLLGVPEERGAVAAAVREWRADDLEQAVVDAGGAAAAMRPIDAWARHDQGGSVRAEPLIDYVAGAAAEPMAAPQRGRPLAGIRILDLTRVLAGPAATRLLAGWGADVLRIDPPDWEEPGVIPEVLLGKRTARLDLRAAAGRDRFRNLLGAADVLVHGYRADALDRLGFGPEVRAAVRPGLVDVTLDAYGWTGPWRARRGFDSLVQMSCGIAEAGMRHYGRDRPTPLPVQALDHATGYLMAAAVIRGLADRRATGRGSRQRLSLARTAALLIEAGPPPADAPQPDANVPLSDHVEHTSWGPARRVASPLAVAGAPLRWSRPARALGTDDPAW
jgi:hypothetical protein